MSWGRAYDDISVGLKEDSAPKINAKLTVWSSCWPKPH